MAALLPYHVECRGARAVGVPHCSWGCCLSIGSKANCPVSPWWPCMLLKGASRAELWCEEPLLAWVVNRQVSIEFCSGSSAALTPLVLFWYSVLKLRVVFLMKRSVDKTLPEHRKYCVMDVCSSARPWKITFLLKRAYCEFSHVFISSEDVENVNTWNISKPITCTLEKKSSLCNSPFLKMNLPIICLLGELVQNQS